MAESKQTDANANLSLRPRKILSQLWDEHVQYEFSTRNTEDTLATMVEDAYVNHIPVLTGGVGRDELREFYSKRFHSADAAGYGDDARLANDRRGPNGGRNGFQVHTHNLVWIGYYRAFAPTGKRVEVPLVAIVRFRDGKLAHEHIYWDQASVLFRSDFDPCKAARRGHESAKKVLDPTLPANELMKRGWCK